MSAAVFLDRDDTLIVNRAVTCGTPVPGDLFDPALVKLCVGAARACTRLKDAGYALVVVSNQGCVARGECSIAQVEATNRRVLEVVAAEAGVELDGLYYCPYHPQGTVAPYNAEHPWRKPNPGMILAATDELGLELGRSWMVGDAERDIVAAVRAGIASERTILLGSGPGNGAGHLASGMGEAAEIILRNGVRKRT